jgi:hypothetical protein
MPESMSQLPAFVARAPTAATTRVQSVDLGTQGTLYEQRRTPASLQSDIGLGWVNNGEIK